MAEAGRIKHHIANNISDARNTILMVGYCAPQTLGARLLQGTEQVSIHGNLYDVKAEIKKIESFSGHGDYKEMIGFLGCQNTDAIEKTFIVHGEYKTQQSYASRLKNEGYRNIEVPASGSEYEL
jgi:metallo-beta-lactamase family protein